MNESGQLSDKTLLYSSVPFKHLAKTYAELIKNNLSEESTLYIIIGSDNGEFPSQLNHFHCPDGTRYLFIEPDSAFENAAKNFTSAETNKSFICDESNWLKSIFALKVENYIHSDRVTVLKSINAATSEKEKYDELFDEVKNQVTSLVRGLKTQNETLVYLEKRLLNIVDLLRPAQLLAGKGKGTALVLAAGPSLDVLLPWIKKHQHQVTIIAVSRLYQQLSQEGVEPDILVSVDPQDINYEQSKPMLAAKKGIFIHSTYVSPRLLAQRDGLSLYLEELYPWEHKDNIINIEVAHPTVSHTAINLALEMGYEQILLAGIDLCYTNTGHTHAGSQTAENPDLYHNTVETYKGTQAETSFFMQMGKNTLEELVQNQNGRVFNLSENAAKIKGIDLLVSPTLPDKATALPEINKPDQQERSFHLNKVKKELAKARLEYSGILKLCKSALKLNQNPTDIKNKDLYHKNQIKIDKIENQLNSQHRKHLPLAQQAVSEKLLKLLKQSDRLQKSVEENYLWLSEYYEAHIEGSSAVIQAIEKAQNNLVMRQMEESKTQHFPELLEYWFAEGLQGRACFCEACKKDEKDKYQGHKQDEFCDYFKQHITFPHKIGVLLDQLRSRKIDFFTDSHLNDVKQLLCTPELFNIQKNVIIPEFKSFLEAFIDHYSGNNDLALVKYQEISSQIKVDNKYFAEYLFRGLIDAILFKLSEIDITISLKEANKYYKLLSQQTLPVTDERKQRLLAYLEATLIFGLAPNIRESIIKSAQSFFVNNKLDSLQYLLETINELFKDNEALIWTSQLIKGMLLQAEGQTDQASIVFTDILDSLLPEGINEKTDLEQIEIEAALLQMLLLSRPEEQINIYMILSEISDKYKPDLAKKLINEGDINNAIVVIQQYITNNPENTETLLDLSELLLESNQAALAQTIYEFVLAQKPNEKRALKSLNKIQNLQV